jgi:predicted nucleic acid-binding protein
LRAIGSIRRANSADRDVEIVKTDPDDNRVVECATAAGSEFSVRGDVDLLALGEFGGITIVTAAKLLAQFECR